LDFIFSEGEEFLIVFLKDIEYQYFTKPLS